jgi:hypothetical protein
LIDFQQLLKPGSREAAKRAKKKLQKQGLSFLVKTDIQIYPFFASLRLGAKIGFCFIQ